VFYCMRTPQANKNKQASKITENMNTELKAMKNMKVQVKL